MRELLGLLHQPQGCLLGRFPRNNGLLVALLLEPGQHPLGRHRPLLLHAPDQPLTPRLADLCLGLDPLQPFATLLHQSIKLVRDAGCQDGPSYLLLAGLTGAGLAASAAFTISATTFGSTSVVTVGG